MSQSASEAAGSQQDEPEPRTGSRGYLTEGGLPPIIRRSMRKAGTEPPKIGRETSQSTMGTQYVLKGVDVFSQQRIMGQRRQAPSTVITEISAVLVALQHGKFSPATL
ncbi:MAG: hypothetical protein OXD31_13020 [Chloroflexi bacterium]|nr:hypothetical protein [Chloroflexota bacterium]